ncbi:MAG TPA: hypothetical protein VJ672_16890 [Gemmatimonadaceae bacterium]|nr:hypothetical protein [Gemmatimonadaceae bacterium]
MALLRETGVGGPEEGRLPYPRQNAPIARSISWKPASDAYYLLAANLRNSGYEHEIYITQRVLLQIQEHAAGMDRDVDGSLWGRVFVSPDSGASYVVIADAIPGTDAESARTGPQMDGPLRLAGWYCSRPTVPMQPPPEDISLHLERCTGGWEPFIVLTSGAQPHDGALFLVNPMAARAFRAPFRELLEPQFVRENAPKRSCIPWRGYVTDEPVVALPIRERVSARHTPTSDESRSAVSLIAEGVAADVRAAARVVSRVMGTTPPRERVNTPTSPARTSPLPDEPPPAPAASTPMTWESRSPTSVETEVESQVAAPPEPESEFEMAESEAAVEELEAEQLEAQQLDSEQFYSEQFGAEEIGAEEIEGDDLDSESLDVEAPDAEPVASAEQTPAAMSEDSIGDEPIAAAPRVVEEPKPAPPPVPRMPVGQSLSIAPTTPVWKAAPNAPSAREPRAADRVAVTAPTAHDATPTDVPKRARSVPSTASGTTSSTASSTNSSGAEKAVSALQSRLDDRASVRDVEGPPANGLKRPIFMTDLADVERRMSPRVAGRKPIKIDEEKRGVPASVLGLAAVLALLASFVLMAVAVQRVRETRAPIAESQAGSLSATDSVTNGSTASPENRPLAATQLPRAQARLVTARTDSLRVALAWYQEIAEDYRGGKLGCALVLQARGRLVTTRDSLGSLLATVPEATRIVEQRALLVQADKLEREAAHMCRNFAR